MKRAEVMEHPTTQSLIGMPPVPQGYDPFANYRVAWNIGSMAIVGLKFGVY